MAGAATDNTCRMPELHIPAPDGDLRAEVSRPSIGSGPWPGVVVIHDVFGFTNHTLEHASRLATAGYLALTPDLYTRGGLVRCVKATFSALASGEGVAYRDLEACRQWLADHPDCTGKVGVIGFCMGGGFALMTANRGFAASAPNYGPLPNDPDRALAGACPVVASYGGKDRGQMRGAAAKLEEALTKAGVVHDVKEYPDAGHSFMDRFNAGPLTPVIRVGGFGYERESAEDAWARVLQFFEQHLGSA